MDFIPYVFCKTQVLSVVDVKGVMLPSANASVDKNHVSVFWNFPSKDIGLPTVHVWKETYSWKGIQTVHAANVHRAPVRDFGHSERAISQVTCDPDAVPCIGGEETDEIGFQCRSILGSLMYNTTHIHHDTTVATSTLAGHVE